MKFDIRDVKIKGKGMIATVAIKPDETICTCTAIRLSDFQSEELRCTSLFKYLFMKDDAYHLALGDVSLVNHSFEPNSKVLWQEDKIHLIATKDISIGDEITHTYSNIDDYDISGWI